MIQTPMMVTVYKLETYCVYMKRVVKGSVHNSAGA